MVLVLGDNLAKTFSSFALPVVMVIGILGIFLGPWYQSSQVIFLLTLLTVQASEHIQTYRPTDLPTDRRTESVLGMLSHPKM